MAAFRAVATLGLIRQSVAGLRPVPQGVRTLAAGAAQKFGAEPESRGPYGKSVFDRHRTQSLIAPRLRRRAEEFKALGVDRSVYGHSRSVDESPPTWLRMAEYLAFGMYTAQAQVRDA